MTNKTGPAVTPSRSLLGADEVCRRLAISRPTLYRWVATGKFPVAQRTPGGRIVADADDLNRWMATLAPAASSNPTGPGAVYLTITTPNVTPRTSSRTGKKTWVVRWRMRCHGGRLADLGLNGPPARQATCHSKAEADHVVASLVLARDAGRAFDWATGRPVEANLAARTTVIDLARRYYDSKVAASASGSELAAVSRALSEAIAVLVSPGCSQSPDEVERRYHVASKGVLTRYPHPEWSGATNVAMLEKVSLSLVHVTTEHAQRVRASLATGRGRGQTTSEATVSHFLSHISRLWEWGRAQDPPIVDRNPFARMATEAKRLHRSVRTLHRQEVLGVDDIWRLAASLALTGRAFAADGVPNGARYSIVPVIVGFAGLRPSEAYALEIRDISDVLAGGDEIVVRRSQRTGRAGHDVDRDRSDSGPFASPLKHRNPKESRTTTITPDGAQALRRYVGDWHGDNPHPLDRVVTQRNGKALTTALMMSVGRYKDGSRRLGPWHSARTASFPPHHPVTVDPKNLILLGRPAIAAAASIGRADPSVSLVPVVDPGHPFHEDPRVHGLRHSWVTILLSAGVDLTLLQAWGGWRDVRTLTEVYAGWIGDERERARAAIARYLGNAA